MKQSNLFVLLFATVSCTYAQHNYRIFVNNSATGDVASIRFSGEGTV